MATYIALSIVGAITFPAAWYLGQKFIPTEASQLIVKPPPFGFTYRWVPTEALTPVFRPDPPPGLNPPPAIGLPYVLIENAGPVAALSIKPRWAILSSNDLENTLATSGALAQAHPALNQGKCKLSGTGIGTTQLYSYDCSDAAESEVIPHCPPFTKPDDGGIALMLPISLINAYGLRIATLQRPLELHEARLVPDIRLTLVFQEQSGEEREKRFLVKTRFVAVRDDVLGHNEVSAQHRSPLNMRGIIRYTVEEEAEY